MMDGNKKVTYAISYGEYSDYRIKATFSSEKLRDDYFAIYKETDREAQTEEFVLDPDPAVILTECIRVVMLKNGDTKLIAKITLNPGLEHWERVGFNGYGNRNMGIYSHLVWVVETDDEERAIKVVNEKRTQIIANNAWCDMKKTRELFGIEEA